MDFFQFLNQLRHRVPRVPLSIEMDATTYGGR
jgi:hypothetical protein